MGTIAKSLPVLHANAMPLSIPGGLHLRGSQGGIEDTDSYGSRVLYKLACGFGLAKPAFQMIRRPITTLTQRRAASGEALARDDDNQCLYAGDYSEREDDRRGDGHSFFDAE